MRFKLCILILANSCLLELKASDPMKLLQSHISKLRSYEAIEYNRYHRTRNFNNWDTSLDVTVSADSFTEQISRIKKSTHVVSTPMNKQAWFSNWFSINDSTAAYLVKSGYRKKSGYDANMLQLMQLINLIDNNKNLQVSLIAKRHFSITHSYTDSMFGKCRYITEVLFGEKSMPLNIKTYSDCEFLLPKNETYNAFREAKVHPKVLGYFVKRRISLSKQYESLPDLPPDTATAFRLLKSFALPDTLKHVLNGENSYPFKELLKTSRLNLIYSWFEGCVPCKKIKPEIESLYLRFKDSGLNVIGLNDVDPMSVIKRSQTSFKNYLDSNALNKIYKGGYPFLLLLDHEGRALASVSGYHPVAITELRKYISEALRH